MSRNIIVIISLLFIAFFGGIIVSSRIIYSNQTTAEPQSEAQTIAAPQPMATFTPTHRQQPLPTDTPAPTNTPIPTRIPTRVPTSTPTPQPLRCDTQIAYKELFRNIEFHEGKTFLFKGNVLQVVIPQDSWDGVSDYLVSISVDEFGFWYDEIYVTTSSHAKPHVRILENDTIIFCASVIGTFQYTSVTGAAVEVPDVLLLKVMSIVE